MITTEDTYDVADKVLEIPVAAIRPAPDNVRSELGDLEGLTASIREVGVLQPVTVIPDAGGDTFMLLLGARRHAAAQGAGLMTIPAIVRSKPDDTKRTVAMLIENVHRLDLSPLDEARTFARLEEEFGLTQEDIKQRVGCSQGHVSKRLSLLALPDSVKTMLDEHTITIVEALELVKLAGHPDALARVLDGWEDNDADERKWAIEEELETIDYEDARQKALDDLTAKKVTVLDAAQVKRAHRVVVSGEYHPMGKLVILVAGDVKKHAKEPCHAVAIADHHFKAKFDPKTCIQQYCIVPDRHDAGGASNLRAVDKAADQAKIKAERRAHEDKLNATRRARLAHRATFVHELVRERKLAKGEVATLALTKVALDGYESGQARTAKLLGIDLKGRTASIAITDFVKGSHDAMLRAALASMLRDAAEPLPGRATMALLEQLGYEPSEEEKAERTAEQKITDAETSLERILDRAEELDSDIDDDLAAMRDELDAGDVTGARADELRLALDAKFAELNDLQPGDVVDQADDGSHTIERAEPVAGVEIDDNEKGCAFPNCTLDAEHEGAHRFKLAGYAKAPKDCSNAEAWARTQIVTVLEQHPDDDEVRGIYEELLAGVDEPRAIEIRERLTELTDKAVLTGYSNGAVGSIEKSCRELILTLPADNQRVIEVQQELYAGVSTSVASALKRRLKAIKADLAAEAKGA